MKSIDTQNRGPGIWNVDTHNIAKTICYINRNHAMGNINFQKIWKVVWEYNLGPEIWAINS